MKKVNSKKSPKLSQGRAFLALIKSKWQFILLVVFTIASLTFMVSAFIPPVYSSEAQFLILQKNLDIDAYRAAKSSEYAGEVLKRVVGSSNFMEGVLINDPGIIDDFGNDPKKRLEEWQKRVKANNIINTGILKVKVLNEIKGQDGKTLQAVNDELSQNGAKYHGNDNIDLKVISGPIHNPEPEYPKVFLNTGIALVLGLFIAIGLLMLFGDEVDSWMFSGKKHENSGKKEPVNYKLSKNNKVPNNTQKHIRNRLNWIKNQDIDNKKSSQAVEMGEIFSKVSKARSINNDNFSKINDFSDGRQNQSDLIL